MSQAGSLRASGGGGGVTSVQGTAPIQVNGVSGVAQTGAVVVSIDPIPSSQFVVFTDQTAPIDYTQIQTVLLYTPANDFYAQCLIFNVTSITGVPGGINYTLGTNGPAYDNLLTSSAQTLDPVGISTVQINFGIVIPAGTPIYLNITAGSTATTTVGTAFLTGVLFP